MGGYTGMGFAQTNREKIHERTLWIQLGRAIGKMEKEELGIAEDYILKGLKVSEEMKNKTKIFYGSFHPL